MPVTSKTALACLVAAGTLAGCQRVTYPDGRVGYSLSPANLVGPAAGDARPVPRGQEANDPYVQQVVPTQAIVEAERRFYDIGLLNIPATLNRCVADAQRGRGDIPQCWALDMHGLIVNVSEMNVRHRPGVPGLDPASAHRRWHVYAAALGVPPDRYQLVEDGTFQRVFAVATTSR